MIFAPIGASAGRSDSVQVLIDGQKISFDVPPRIENGRVLVPFRSVFTHLGGKVSWKSEKKLNPEAGYYRTGELMYGITDLFSDRELEFSFILLPQTEMNEIFTKAKDPVLPVDGRHDRGTFPGGDRLIEITLGNNLNGFLIGDGFSDPTLIGKDQAAGSSVQLLGNYGVHYRMKASFDASAAILLIPLGGDIFSGGIATSEELFSLNKVPTFSKALYLGEYHKGDQAEWSFMPPAGSSLPVLIISVPMT